MTKHTRNKFFPQNAFHTCALYLKLYVKSGKIETESFFTSCSKESPRVVFSVQNSFSFFEAANLFSFLFLFRPMSRSLFVLLVPALHAIIIIIPPS